ncbi:MAG: hypothetical protein ACRD5H_14030, partial [Nitrososphaerales archaeon]
AAFQRKCLGKIDKLSKTGRTILFVSHNMNAILRLCSRAILLRQGELILSGSPRSVIDCYTDDPGAVSGGTKIWFPTDATHKSFRPICARILQKGQLVDRIASSDPFTIEFEYGLVERLPHLLIQVEISTTEGVSVLTTQDRDDLLQEHSNAVNREPGRYVASCDLPANFFNSGTFTVSINATSRPKLDHYFYAQHALIFTINAVGGVGSHLNTNPRSLIRPLLPWSVKRIETSP